MCIGIVSDNQRYSFWFSGFPLTRFMIDIPIIQPYHGPIFRMNLKSFGPFFAGSIVILLMLVRKPAFPESSKDRRVVYLRIRGKKPLGMK